MNVSPVNVNPTAFKGHEQTKKTGGGGKAVASALIPGLGQFCDGRNKAGAGFLGGAIGLGILNRIIAASILKTIMENIHNQNMKEMGVKFLVDPIKKLPKAKLIAPIAIGLASTGLWIANIVDAYKGGKKHQSIEE